MPTPLYGNPSNPTGGYYNAPQGVPGIDFGVGEPPQWSGSWTNATGLNVGMLDSAIANYANLVDDAKFIVSLVADYNSKFGVSPWGTDAMGSSFESAFKPVADQAVAGTEGLAKLIENIVTGLTSTRDTLRNTELSNGL